jgi:Zn-finger nucleic acid-binding protein
MKLLLAMLAAGLIGAAPLMAQNAGETKTSGKVIVLGEDEECPECEGIEIDGEELEKALEEALKDEKLPQELKDALKKALEEHRKAAKEANEGDVDETTEETLPDGTKVVRRIVRKTSKSESKEKSTETPKGEPEKSLDEQLKKLREEMKKLQEEIDRKIEEELGGEDGDATETIEKVLPDGTRVKIVKSVSRKTSGEAPKAPKNEDKPNKQ